MIESTLSDAAAEARYGPGWRTVLAVLHQVSTLTPEQFAWANVFALQFAQAHAALDDVSEERVAAVIAFAAADNAGRSAMWTAARDDTWQAARWTAEYERVRQLDDTVAEWWTEAAAWGAVGAACAAVVADLAGTGGLAVVADLVGTDGLEERHIATLTEPWREIIGRGQ